MAKFGDKELTLAGVYTTAMLELAESTGQADVLLDEWRDLAHKVDQDVEFALFFSSPMIDAAAREKTIEKLFRARYSDLLVDSLQILNRKGRLAMVRSVAETYRLAHSARSGQIDVRVTTVVPLEDSLRRRLSELTATYTGKEPRLIETLDPSILGGLVVQIGDEKFDMSVATRLVRLGRAMMDRASRELHNAKTFFESGDLIGGGPFEGQPSHT